MNRLKVKENVSLVRDMSSNAIINTNGADLNEYLRNRKIILDRKSQIQNQSLEINTLKQDISEIKQMLAMLIKTKEN
jgi:hypothetical protein